MIYLNTSIGFSWHLCCVAITLSPVQVATFDLSKICKTKFRQLLRKVFSQLTFYFTAWYKHGLLGNNDIDLIIQNSVSAGDLPYKSIDVKTARLFIAGKVAPSPRDGIFCNAYQVGYIAVEFY
jgi:hypothetical protein